MRPSKSGGKNMPTEREIDFAEFDEGSLVELVATPSARRNLRGEDAKLRLLIWDGERAQLTERFAHGQTVYMPRRLDPNVVCAVRLPAGIAEFGSTRSLFDETAALIRSADVLRDSDVAQVGNFVFSTWFPERLSIAPFLWLIAPSAAPRERLLQVLGLLCRRSLFINELGMAPLRSLPVQLRPTLIAEAAAVSRSLLRALHASNRQESYDVAGGKFRELFCAKIICADHPFGDSAADGFPLEIALSPSRERVPPMPTDEAERIAREFQAKFLRYRLMHFQKVGKTTVDLSEFSSPVQDLARNLAACIVGDEELRHRIIPLLKERDRELRVDATLLLDAIVIEVLLAACHEANVRARSMWELARDVNTVLAARGEALQVSPERVGWKLRALDFHTDFITGGRKGLRLDEVVRAKIHSLAAAYGVRTLLQDPESMKCSHCFRMIERPDAPGPSDR
jgi:hypothetical protein